ncbi:MAG: DUF1943 domain-containing protein [Providencia heimbachae]|nr:DUF1943 domain-containing protein [Providencia heimbachae]
MVSSVNRLVEVVSSQFKNQETENERHQSSEDKWTVEKISKMLNMKPEEAEKLEAIISTRLFNTKRFFAFDNQTLNTLPKGDY